MLQKISTDKAPAAIGNPNASTNFATASTHERNAQ